MATPAKLLMELKQLFGRMDQAYQKAADAFGFVCHGCEQNCCRSLFYHHTLAEYLYIKDGMDHLPVGDQKRVRYRAASVVQQMNSADRPGVSPNVWCPLNEDERCILYEHRPMICRLHGIPHQLRRPDGQRQMGSGCDDFDRRCGHTSGTPLDRTPLYMALADLERRLRHQLDFDQKIKITIAQMLIDVIGVGGQPVKPPSG